MSKHLSAVKRDRHRVWCRSNPTGFVRPQRNFFKAKMRLYRKLQKALKQQMIDNLANAGLGPGVTAGGSDELEVKEIL